jgi:hypothetical protein
VSLSISIVRLERVIICKLSKENVG